ncbi:hypothetical protein Ancab_001128 [Ancistrocladus abbreviatus]
MDAEGHGSGSLWPGRLHLRPHSPSPWSLSSPSLAPASTLQRGDWPSQVATATDHDHDHADPDSLTIDVGLDEATLRSFPKLLYSHAKVHQGEPTASSCSICLGNYKEKDTLRLLPGLWASLPFEVR